MFKPNAYPDASPLFDAFRPDKILYFYDEPLLFTQTKGVVTYLCQKTDEEDGVAQHVVVPITDSMLNAITSNRISLYSAFANTICWLVVSDQAGKCVASWTMQSANLPREMLPEKSSALYSHEASVPDIYVYVPSHDPFLTFKFLGTDVEHGTMDFNEFKGLTDGVYFSLKHYLKDVAANATNDNLSDVALNKMLDIRVREPKFASLSLEVEKPFLDALRLKKKIEFDGDFINDTLSNAGSELTKDLTNLTTQKNYSNNVDDITMGERRVVESLIDIMPSAETDFSVLEITSSASDGTSRMVRVDRASGGRLQHIFHLLGHEPRPQSGDVVEISFRSKTFILRTDKQREITCVFRRSKGAREVLQVLKEGMTLQIAGTLVRRTNRDKIYVDEIADAAGTILYTSGWGGES